MVLINLGVFILLIGLVIALSFKFFWIVSIIFLYRFITYFITFSFIKETFGIENQFYYFLLMLGLAFAIHYIIFRLTYEMDWIRYAILIIIVIWVFTVYDFLEIFLLKDWLQANGVWGAEGIQTNIKELFSTSPEQFKGYFLDALKKLNEIVDGIFGFFLNRE